MFRKEIKGGPRFLIRSNHANVVMYGVFETAISKDNLKKAVLLLSDKHKLLDCHIETEEENKAYYLIDKKLSPEINTSKSKDIDKILIDEIKHRFNIEKGPLIRFTLLNQTTLVINCHHAICDGRSLVYLFKDITKILAGEKIKIEQKMPVFLELENLSQKVGNPISKFFIGLMNKKCSKETVSFSDQLSHELHTDYWKGYKPQIIQFKFSKEETANIISRCKQNNVSVNSGLVASILYAENKVFGKKDNSSKVIITDNLRTYLKDQPGENLGYFVSTLKPDLEYNEEKTFWENAQIFNKKIKRLLEKDILKNQVVDLFSPKLLDMVMLNLFGKREDKLAQKIIKKAGMYKNYATFTIANLGLIKPEDNSGKFKLKELFGPFAVSEAMEKYVSVLTINNQLHFSISFNEKDMSKELILKIIKLIPQIFNDRPR